MDAGHDVIWSGDWPSDPGDEEILTRAHAERRVLITLDKDLASLRSCAEFRTVVWSGSPAFHWRRRQPQSSVCSCFTETGCHTEPS